MVTTTRMPPPHRQANTSTANVQRLRSGHDHPRGASPKRSPGGRESEERLDPSQLRLVPSVIHVLKLHGSCGWHRRSADRFYFDHYLFLDRFGFESEGEPFYFADPMHPDYDLDDPILLYPSFLKQLDDPHLLAIWRAAHAAPLRPPRAAHCPLRPYGTGTAAGW